MLNIADMRTRHSREAFDSLREHFGEKLIDTTIRASIAYAESAERAVSILDYRPDLGVDYLNVADELLSRLGLDDARERLAPLLREAQPAVVLARPRPPTSSATRQTSSARPRPLDRALIGPERPRRERQAGDQQQRQEPGARGHEPPVGVARGRRRGRPPRPS